MAVWSLSHGNVKGPRAEVNSPKQKGCCPQPRDASGTDSVFMKGSLENAASEDLDEEVILLQVYFASRVMKLRGSVKGMGITKCEVLLFKRLAVKCSLPSLLLRYRRYLAQISLLISG